MLFRVIIMIVFFFHIFSWELLYLKYKFSKLFSIWTIWLWEIFDLFVFHFISCDTIAIITYGSLIYHEQVIIYIRFYKD